MNDPDATLDTSSSTAAADWYARVRSPDLSEIDAARFRAWLARDPANRQAFEEFDALWDDLAAIKDSPEVARERVAISAARRLTGQRVGWQPWPFAVAATLLIAMGATYVYQQWGSDTFVTAVGEQRIIPLADGSIITLNTATRVRLHFSDKERAVELLSGEANFEVAKDPQRPFVVNAGGGRIRAVGTVFDVYRTSSAVTVTLIEGKVLFVPAYQSTDADPNPENRLGSGSIETAEQAPKRSASRASEIYLTAGQQLSYATQAGTITRSEADMPRVSAWRARKLDFHDMPLGDAIAEANRYSSLQIVLDAPGLQQARISGTFEAGRNDLFVEGLQSYFHLRATHPAKNRILLKSE